MFRPLHLDGRRLCQLRVGGYELVRGQHELATPSVRERLHDRLLERLVGLLREVAVGRDSPRGLERQVAEGEQDGRDDQRLLRLRDLRVVAQEVVDPPTAGQQPLVVLLQHDGVVQHEVQVVTWAPEANDGEAGQVQQGFRLCGSTRVHERRHDAPGVGLATDGDRNDVPVPAQVPGVVQHPVDRVLLHVRGGGRFARAEPRAAVLPGLGLALDQQHRVQLLHVAHDELRPAGTRPVLAGAAQRLRDRGVAADLLLDHDAVRELV